MPMEYNSYLVVDLDQLHRNVENLLEKLGNEVQMIPVLKDNAYGLGMVPLAQALLKFPDIKTLAVAHVIEGVALRQSELDRDVEILVMGGIPNSLCGLAVEHRLTVAVGRLELVHHLAREAQRLGTTAKIQIKIETGLNRIGMRPGEELAEFLRELDQCRPYVQVTGAFTHFADLSNQDRSQKQFAAYQAGVSQLEAGGVSVPLRHISASEACEYYPQYKLDGVRVGRALNWDHPTAPLGDVKETVSWRTTITNLRRLNRGDDLGYGGLFHLDHDAVIATIGVGYGDGINRELVHQHAPVLVCGQRAPLMACCMDQSMIDVTDLPCKIDDEVTLFGWDKEGNFLSAQELARFVPGIEAPGLTSSLTDRVARIYKQT